MDIPTGGKIFKERESIMMAPGCGIDTISRPNF
jgi:hypothetical protein